MNQKNSLGIDLCFKDLNNPIDLFGQWFNEAKKNEKFKEVANKKIGRNERCLCGSGKKYKHCCGRAA